LYQLLAVQEFSHDGSSEFLAGHFSPGMGEQAAEALSESEQADHKSSFSAEMQRQLIGPRLDI